MAQNRLWLVHGYEDRIVRNAHDLALELSMAGGLLGVEEFSPVDAEPLTPVDWTKLAHEAALTHPVELSGDCTAQLAHLTQAILALRP